MKKQFIFKSIFIASSVLLTLGNLIGLILSVWSDCLSLAAMDVQISGMVLLMIIPGYFWTLVILLAGILALLSLKWRKLRSAGMVLGLLFGVRTAVSLVESFIYSNFTYIGSTLALFILLLAFIISALKMD